MKKNLLLSVKSLSKRTTLYVAVGAAVMMLANSCCKKDSDAKPDVKNVLLELDWQQLVQGEQAPERMSVYLYGADGSLKRGASEGTKFIAQLPTGTYQVLAVNEDAANVAFANMERYDEAYAYALPVSNGADADEPWIRQPEWLYAACIEELDVAGHDTVKRTLIPKPLVRRITLNIRLEGDSQAVTGLSAAMSGVASSVGLATGNYGGAHASVTEFDARPTQNGYMAQGLVFGIMETLPDGSPVAKSVRFGIGFNNGGSQVLEEHIDNGMIGDPTETEIDITLDIQVAPTSEAGFAATLTGWKVKDVGMDVDNRP